MANKTTKSSKEEAIMRAISQERKSLIQGIIFNLCSGKGDISEDCGESIVETAIAMADHYIKMMYIPTQEED